MILKIIIVSSSKITRVDLIIITLASIERVLLLSPREWVFDNSKLKQS